MAKTLHEIRLAINELRTDFFMASATCEFRSGVGCRHEDNHVDFMLVSLCELEDCPVVHEGFIRISKHKSEEPRCICNWFPGYNIYCSTHKGLL